MGKFEQFGRLVADSFQRLTKAGETFVVAVDGDTLFAEYLNAFPDGTNPIYKTRTEHDCSCCKQFIRRAGNVVAVVDGAYRTVWDEAAQKASFPYNIVAERLRDLVKEAPIIDLYRVAQNEASFGAKTTLSQNKASGDPIVWDHFYTGSLPSALRVSSPGTVCGEYRSAVQVFERGLRELSPEAIETVRSLIEANNLYRGEEHKRAVLEFQAAQQAFQSAESDWARNVFVWTNASRPAARFRNTVIGTLVQDLSEGTDVDVAVCSFEAKVAPSNYKRPSAIITPSMVKKAMETVSSLGLESALERRFAVISDVSVRDVLWVDGGIRPAMKGTLHEALLQHAATTAPPRGVDLDEARAEEIALDAFVARVLPETTAVEIFFKGSHTGSLVSLTAPVHLGSKPLFKWDNHFAWSYTGNVADSIAERVKKAGGKVEGATLRVSLSWFNTDDLDLHVHEPGYGGLGRSKHICFHHKRGWSGGELDVDMNVTSPVRDAVENVVWMKTIPNGAYSIVVNNYRQRETSNPGFVVEIESAGKLTHYAYNRVVRDKQNVRVATIHVHGGAVQRVEVGDPEVTTSTASQERWGLKTERYIKVNAVTLSPNYWGENAVGNKHTFFFLDGCKSDEPTRGFYNEFLRASLEPHRKVFEVISDKTKCVPIDNQLSGLGFSSTKKATILIKVRQGQKQRLFNVRVGT